MAWGHIIANIEAMKEVTQKRESAQRDSDRRSERKGERKKTMVPVHWEYHPVTGQPLSGTELIEDL